MLATITALFLGTAGVGLGTAGCVLAARAGARQQALLGRVDQQIGLVAGELVKHSTALTMSQDLKTAQALGEINARLDGLEFTAAEQLITRGEVSQAFAELAAIEEQRQRQVAAMRTATPATAPMAAKPIAAAFGDPGAAPAANPWAEPPQESAAPPADPAALISEITSMNERLRERLRSAGVLNS